MLLVPLEHRPGHAVKLRTSLLEELELVMPQLPQPMHGPWFFMVVLLGEAQCSGKIVVDDASVDCPRGAVAVGGISMQ